MIALNHAFLEGIAHRPVDTSGLRLIEHVRRRMGALPLVHPGFASVDTGDGPFVRWANRIMRDPDRAPLVELCLRMTSGPFIEGDAFRGVVTPPVDGLPEWIAEIVRILVAVPADRGITGMVSPAPTGGADALSYVGGDRAVSNWRGSEAFDRDLTATGPERTTLHILCQAEREMPGQLIVLPSAVRSAERWTRDCTAVDLHKALLGLEHYVAALLERLPREQCAARYHDRTGIPMSQESPGTWRLPTRRRQRVFHAGDHGDQYFDMHAKPGNLTRVHIWVPTTGGDGERPVIYVGHCGKHLA